jgi:hypothetical protein
MNDGDDIKPNRFFLVLKALTVEITVRHPKSMAKWITALGPAHYGAGASGNGCR